MTFFNTKTVRNVAVFIAVFVSSSRLTYAQTNADVDFSDTIHLAFNTNFNGYSSLDSVMKGKQVFIAGENHTFLESNSKLWVKNIKYLHKNAGLRNVFMETGRSNAWLVNSYVQSGDTALYSVIKKYLFEEYARAYKELMKFNATLDDSAKIQVIGIDLERGGFGALKVLSLLLPEGRLPHDSIDLHIESLQGIVMYQDREIFNKEDEEEESQYFYGYTYSARNTLNLILENFDKHEAEYKTYLGDSFPLFNDILTGLKDAKYWSELESTKSVQAYVYREKYMYKRFLEEYAKHTGAYYGQFGRCHATKKRADKNACEWYVFKSLANRLKHSTEVNLKGKILAMGILYNSDSDYKTGDWESVSEHIDDLFGKLDKGRVLLYNLANDTVLNAFFADDFDYLFLNTNNPDREHPYFNEDFEDFSSPVDARLKVMYGYGQYEIDLEAIGELHSLGNRAQYSEPLTVHGFFMGTGNSNVKSVTSGTYVGIVKGVKSQETDSLSSSLSGFIYSSQVLVDILPQVKVIDAMLGGSLGYSQLQLKVKRENNAEGLPIASGFVGERSTAVYRNPAVTARLLLRCDINLGRFTIGADVGSAYDLSKKNWRLDGDLLNSGPKTSFKGLFANAYVGFNFVL